MKKQGFLILSNRQKKEPLSFCQRKTIGSKVSQRVVGAQKKVIFKLRKISCADKWEANKNLSNSKHTRACLGLV